MTTRTVHGPRKVGSRRGAGLRAVLTGRLCRTVIWCFSAVSVFCGRSEGAAKKPPPPRPLQVSAWCAFNIPREIRFRVPNKKLKLTDTRPAARNRIGCARRGRWFPLWVELRNTTKEKSFSGVMNIRTRSGKAKDVGKRLYTTIYRRRFEIGSGTTKRYRFSILYPDNGMSENAWNSFSVEISSDGRQSAARRVTLRDVTDERLIAVVSDKPGAFRRLATAGRDFSPPKGQEEAALDEEVAGVLNGAGGNDETFRERRRIVVDVPPEELPDRAHDLAAADLIILDGPPRTGLTDAQYRALFDYCLAGGRLLVIAGREPARLRAEPGRQWSVERLTGLRVLGTTEVHHLELDPPFRPKPGNIWALPLIKTEPVAGSGFHISIYRETGTGVVLMAVRQTGRGAVSFLPFPLGDKLLAGWEGRTRIPLDELRAAHRLELFPAVNYAAADLEVASVPRTETNPEEQGAGKDLMKLRDALDNSFAKDTPVETPKPPLVLVFLLFYLLAAVPLNYLIFGKLNKREAAWTATPLWALLFAGAAYFLGFYGKLGRLTINEVSVVETASGVDHGAARTFIGLYTPHRGDYRFDFPPAAEAAPRHLEARLVARELSNLPEMELEETEEGLRISRLYSATRDTRRLEITHRAELGRGVEVRVRPLARGSAEGRRIGLRNLTGKELVNPVLIVGDRARPLTANGVLPPVSGGALRWTELTGAPASWPSADEAFFGKAPAFSTVRGPYLVRRALALGAYVRARLESSPDIVFAAWLDRGLLPLEVNGDEPRRWEGVSLLLIPLTTPGAVESDVSWAHLPERMLALKDISLLVSEKWTKPDRKDGVPLEAGSCFLRLRPRHGLGALAAPKLRLSFRLTVAKDSEGVLSSMPLNLLVEARAPAGGPPRVFRPDLKNRNPEDEANCVWKFTMPLSEIWRGEGDVLLLQVKVQAPQALGKLSLRRLRAWIVGRSLVEFRKR